MKNFLENWKQDFPAGLVVFLVALPLCLGVALASTGENPILFSGIIAGAVGGVIVGALSGSRLGVAGPAAGLITIVAAAITTLGGFDAFLVAVVLAGLIQFCSGFLGAGIIGNYFPSSVIKGMLAAIGLTLILKEIPHAFGYDTDFMGDQAFYQSDGQNTFSEILVALGKTSPGAIIITALSLGILILMEKPFMRKIVLFRLVPGALVVVVLAIVLNQFFLQIKPDWYLNGKHLVELPKAKNWQEFQGFFTFPDFSILSNYKVYAIALTIALVASLETLLSVEATDKLDPHKHHTPTERTRVV
jgi:MFS superfamily sulfate permease-like transporter